MLQISIVVLREVIEISLIIGILSAATNGIKNNYKWIFSGLFSGLLFSFLLAFFTDKISDSLDGFGQEVFNAIVLMISSATIGWTAIWMQKHSKSMSNKLKTIGSEISSGQSSLYSLFLVTFFAVLREGSEISLFAYSSYLSGVDLFEILYGMLFGIISGAIAGYSFYFGILKFFGKYFFSVTTWLLIFLSAGIAGNSIVFLNNANIIPAFKNPLFDVSSIISQESFFGKFLNILIGYSDRPSTSQFIVYILVLLVLILCLRNSKNIKKSDTKNV